MGTNKTKEAEHHKITPTADLISYFRTFSDIPYVNEIAKITNAEKIIKENFGEDILNQPYLAPISEARYKKINFCVKDFKNIIEVAVGRSPRDLIFTKDKSVTYVATDLPDSLEQHKKIINELINNHKLERPNLYFVPANALNYSELEKAEKILPPGKIAIISEGFMVYLSFDEKKKFLENVHKLLEKRDGIFVTSDIMIFSEQEKSNGIPSPITKATGRDMGDRNFPSIGEAEKFLQDSGFNVKIVNPKIDLVSTKKLGLESDAISEKLTSPPIWVLTINN